MTQPLSGFRTILTYYGDDFTGSTDALEALALNGIESVLFLDTPPEDALERFPACRAVGLAGEGRSRNPEWMSAHLPAVFERLKRFGAPICQYKVCSTFDSSPETGNIGRAAEIGQAVFGAPYVPVVVAAPHLKRYVLFGNLFAAAGESPIYRIDRHPVMRCHPVTPMDEADLGRHLMRQTRREAGSVDILALQNGGADRAFEAAVTGGAQLIVFDGLDEASLRECGRLLWHRPPGFAVGSSGLTYALICFWRACGWIPPAPEPRKAEAVDRLVVLSGSCSPVGERQIRWAMENGFTGVRLDAVGFAAGGEGRETALREGLNVLADGRNVVLYSALGQSGANQSIQRDELGRQMGLLLRDLLLKSGVRRAVIAGGDTSSHAGRQLGVAALTFHAPLSPGAPLCRAHSDSPELDGLQLVFKGGQVGPEHFFGMALTGEI